MDKPVALLAESELDKAALKDLLNRNVWSASLIPNLRHRSATGTPASASRKTRLTCSSLNLDRFIRSSSTLS